MDVLETFFHQLYAESNCFRWKKLFELHFLILNIFLSFSPCAAVNFLSKIMFKKKLDFFPLKWAMVESGVKEINADLKKIIFFGSLSTINRHVFFCLAKKNFFTSIRFFEFSKKWYFRHSKRTFKPVYLEKNCSHEKFSKLRKLEFWLFFTEIGAKKLLKYFLTYKSKEINAKSIFSKFVPFRNFFFHGCRFFEVCYKIWRLNQNGWIIDSEVMEFWRASRGLARNPGASTRGERFTCDIDYQSNMEWPIYMQSNLLKLIKCTRKIIAL